MLEVDRRYAGDGDPAKLEKRKELQASFDRLSTRKAIHLGHWTPLEVVPLGVEVSQTLPRCPRPQIQILLLLLARDSLEGKDSLMTLFKVNGIHQHCPQRKVYPHGLKHPLVFGNEEQQLEWAKRESERAEHERLERLRRQEQEDLELAIALSKAEMSNV
ncbi:hypothetical protein scyTo_0006196 [Scyliorhinus torazame]|uniref:Uncharacterized protein n=1 Tax=Scyliorhinus torazame TaxID=75743 RepID=A0A401PGF7_SCYTO|nr:hypothetical protein [Scyliorhinus torazame]